jgi:large subunit ribosomal protein L25
MASTDTTRLSLRTREPSGSRSARRLRREGRVPGVVYGGDGEPVAFDADARELRRALADAGAVIEVTFDDDSKTTPVVIKDQQRHPVAGDTVHIDLLRVRLDKPIDAQVTLELVGVDDAPGVKEGGVLEQVTRELNIQALPTEIPDSITYDVSEMQINDTVTLSAVKVPPSVTLLDDLEETVIATLSPPRVAEEPEPGVEEETERVGEEGEAPAEEGGEDAAEGGDGDGSE